MVLRCREGRTFQGVNIVARRVLGAVAVGVVDAAKLRLLHLMNRRTVARWAVAVLLLAGCSIKGGSDSHGTPTFPPPGPLPPVGTAWQTEDGSAGLRLVSDGTAEVWGLPWYRTTPGSCDEKDLEYVSATGKVSTIVDPLSSQLSVEFDLSKSPNDIVTAGRNFYRSNDFEGWQVLSYSSCILFNDGHNLVFHMVGQ